MLFLNTRPAERAATLTQFLKAHQVDVLDLPLLELAPMPWSESLKALYAALASVQIIVAVSPSAVTYGMQGLVRAGLTAESLSHVQWIAVGDATAQALKDYGFSSHVPEVETSEGMLDLPLLHKLAPNVKIAFWRGEGGRQFMMNSLHEKGIELLNFVLYWRKCPEQASRILTKNLLRLQRQQGYCMLVTSEASWRNWQMLIVEHSEVLHQAHFLVLGERLFHLLEQDRQAHQYLFHIYQLNDLRKESILKQIAAVQGTP